MTPYERYVKRLAELKQTSEGIIAGSAIAMQNVIWEALLAWMDDTLDLQGGELVASAETIDLLNDFSEGFRRTITKLAPWKENIGRFLKSLGPMADAITEHQLTANGVKLPKKSLSDAQALVIDNIIDAYTGNGLNANIVQPLRDLLFQNISVGSRLQDAKSFLKQYVKGGNDKSGKVERYLNNTAQQAVDGYTGIINKKLMDAFSFTHMIVSGSIITTSAPQCRLAVKTLRGVITKEQYDNQIVPIAEKNGLIKGTTFENLPLNKLHHGCRHEFTPSMLKDGDRIGTNEVYRNGAVVNE